jgi:hypothetical protein
LSKIARSASAAEALRHWNADPHGRRELRVRLRHEPDTINRGHLRALLSMIHDNPALANVAGESLKHQIGELIGQ